MIEKGFGMKEKKFKMKIGVFGLNWLIAMIAFGYFLVKYNGLFSLSNDFNAQELPFNIFANRAVKSGDIYFNWAIDMGSDFISSFSFYNLGSPFFWVSLLFPPTAFPYLVGWIFMLKYAVVGLTSYLYFERYTKNQWCAVIGSVLYAFCGYQAANIVFYHFHDVVALFPLLLIGLEQLIEEKRYGKFALFVSVNVLVNWNFFIGEVVFLIAYYIIRYSVITMIKERKWKELVIQVSQCFLEGLLGVGMAAVLFIPSIYAILSNGRVSNHILGANAVSFSSRDYLQFIKALLLPNETLSNQSVLAASNWYSNAAYLPAVGILFVVAYMMEQKKDWIDKILKLSLITALIPLFNNIFTLFNAESYRRWYYMPILIMVLASIKIIERTREDEKVKKNVVKAGRGIVVAILLLSTYLLFFKWSNDIENAINSLPAFFCYLLLGLSSILIVLLLVKHFKKYFYLLLFVLIASVGCLNIMLNIVRYHQNEKWNSAQEVYNEIVRTGEDLESDILPYRYTLDDSYYNRNMGSSLTSVNSFISTVDTGIFEFYDGIGKHRHTQTPAGPDGTNELLSVRYYITEKKQEDKEAVQIKHNGNCEVYIYEDPTALPVGFTYDSYILQSEFQKLDKAVLSRVMLSTLVVKDEDEPIVKRVLEHYDLSTEKEFSAQNKYADILSHKAESSIEFKHSFTGFTSKIVCDKDKYAFFSVPFGKRWSASVNGESVEILNINGLMAVPVFAGDNQIQFFYSTAINKISFIISVLSTIIVISIIIISNKNIKYKKINT